MAVQKSKKTRSRRGMRRSHDAITTPAVSVDAVTGETHLRHNMTADGFYRGKKILPDVEEAVEIEDEDTEQ